jgi:hypothetical protein
VLLVKRVIPAYKVSLDKREILDLEYIGVKRACTRVNTQHYEAINKMHHSNSYYSLYSQHITSKEIKDQIRFMPLFGFFFIYLINKRMINFINNVMKTRYAFK